MRLEDHFLFWYNYLTRKNTLPHITLTNTEQERIKFYCKEQPMVRLKGAISANALPKTKSSTYTYDWFNIIDRNDSRRCHIVFGDVRQVYWQPTFVKSRPISESNHNNVLLPLHSHRHLTFYKDPIPFEKKSSTAIWRGAAYQSHRKTFLSETSALNICNCMDTSRDTVQKNRRSINYLTPHQHFKHKFIFAIEGNELASNLKWIMSSNSIPVMPQPKYEGWFCESMLEAGRHYIEIKDDFSNINEVLDYYLTYPKECKEIAEEGTIYAANFHNLSRQYALARIVTEEYFSRYK